MASSPRFAKVYSAELEGINAQPIEVEVDLHVGLHSFNIVGLADKALTEARDRVSSALKNSGCKPPNRENRKITVNLAPADIKKAGSQYDLAIAMGYLLATGQVDSAVNLDKLVLVGELALDGALRSANGALNIAEMAAKQGFTTVLLPQANAAEATAIRDINVVSLTSLEEAIDFVETGEAPRPAPKRSTAAKIEAGIPDFSDIKGQETAKRTLAIAAAGGHNVLMEGPPGVGKSYLAKAMVGILPPLSTDEAIEVTKVWSAAGLSGGALRTARPFRAPHQTASRVSVVGGGTHPRPGEISLAHRGILFLDEVPEFPRSVLESLRAPMEDGRVRVARAKRTVSFPARFTLMAAMNPCPCGFYADAEKECSCTANQIQRYQKKISGPLLDRIDLQIHVPRVAIKRLQSKEQGAQTSKDIREQVVATRQRQTERFKKSTTTLNAEMNPHEIKQFVPLGGKAQEFIKKAEAAHLSPRGYYRILKVARTIADLEGADEVAMEHLAEAFGYRVRERSGL